MNKLKPLLLVAALSAAAIAAAQGSSATATATGSASANAAAFQCGGVGVQDQQRMKAEAGSHDLMLTFATPTGAYLADVDVQIRRAGQVVLSGHCGGPLMLVDLAPKGSYEIQASSEGRVQRKTVTLGAHKPASVSFVWPAG